MRCIYDSKGPHEQVLLLMVERLLIDTDFDLHSVELLILEHLQGLDRYLTSVCEELFRLLD